MSVHCMNATWKLSDPVPDGLLDNILVAVETNVKMNIGAFAVLCHGDSLILELMRIKWTAKDDRKKIDEIVERRAPDGAAGDNYRRIANFVFDNWDKR